MTVSFGSGLEFSLVSVSNPKEKSMEEKFFESMEEKQPQLKQEVVDLTDLNKLTSPQLCAGIEQVLAQGDTETAEKIGKHFFLNHGADFGQMGMSYPEAYKVITGQDPVCDLI